MSLLLFDLMVCNIVNFNSSRPQKQGHKIIMFVLYLALNVCYYWYFFLHINLAMSREKVPLNICRIHRIRSYCTSAKYNPSLCSPFIHSVVSNDSVHRQGRPGSDCADAQADLGLHCQHRPIAWCSPTLYYIMLSFADLIFEIMGCGSRSSHLLKATSMLAESRLHY